MDKATTLTLIGLGLAYFSVSKERLTDLKICVTWVCWAAFIIAEAHSAYLIVMSNEPFTLVRILAANFAAMGALILVVAAFVCGSELRGIYEPKKPK